MPLESILMKNKARTHRTGLLTSQGVLRFLLLSGSRELLALGKRDPRPFRPFAPFNVCRFCIEVVFSRGRGGSARFIKDLTHDNPFLPFQLRG